MSEYDLGTHARINKIGSLHQHLDVTGSAAAVV